MDSGTYDSEAPCDYARLYTYARNDGRKVTYSDNGRGEAYAFRRARKAHGNTLLITPERTHSCMCAVKSAESVRQAGWLVCRECAGLIGG